MPRKKILPEEIQNIVDQVREKEQKEDAKEARELVQKIREERVRNSDYWDVKIGDKIEVFDPTLSYEITGYRPIDETHGLDFNPDWFTETREVYKRTSQYCPYLRDSKRYNEFWKEQYRRCKYGMTVNGYTITGDNYFFLNFYQLPTIDQQKASGEGTDNDFPIFFASHYMFFHYLQMARVLHKHAALMKARSIGFSEINASLSARMYSVIRRSRVMITCFNDTFLKGTFSKFDNALTFLNTCTGGGFFKLRLIDQDLRKKSGKQIKINGQFEDVGFKSEVVAINGAKPSNIRGDRVDLLIYDEAGSWPGLDTAVVQGQELCEVQGMPRGTMLFGGTGGDMGAPLEGLKKIYYNPRAYKILPFRHNWTQDGTTIESGFFIPYFIQSLNPEFMDHRGVCNTVEYKKFLQEERDNLLAVPEDYLKKCAERCWNAEEAFNLEGVNKFNKILVAEQIANIRLKQIGPRPECGYIDYFYKNNKHTQGNIDGFKWIPNSNGKVKILEHPIWSDLYKEQMEKLRQEAEDNGQDFEVPVYKEMRDLYVAGIDGIDIGANQTSKETRDPSDFCITIKKRAFGMNDPQYVAMYKDRPGDIREAYKIAMCLARYYNCKINIEATRMGMVTWAREKGCLNYFMKRPRATLTDVRNGTTKQYGTPATKTIIEQHTDLTAAFIEDYCHTIWFEEMLEQFTAYNDENKGKYDIVAAVGMTELADQELSGRQPVLVEKEVEQFQDFGYYYDERGIKRFGVIPTKKTPELNMQRNEYDDPYRVETSDPRIYEGLVQNGVYRRTRY